MTVSGEELEAHLERERSMADRVPNKTALKDITYGSVAGMVSKVFEHPFDLVKVRLQSQPHDRPLRYRGPFDCFAQTFRNEGIRGLYRGVSMPIAGAMAENATLFLVYNQTQRLIRHLDPRLSPTEGLPLARLALAAGTAGAAASFVLTPIELVKCRMQVQQLALEGLAPVPGLSPEKAKALPGPVALTRSTIAENGIKGMWLGQTGTLLRETGGGIAWFCAFEALTRAMVKRRRKNGELNVRGKGDLKDWELMTAGAAGGVSYNVVLFPADSIKSTIQTEAEMSRGRPSAGPLVKRGFLQVGRDIVKARGWRGLYAGCGITCLRSGPSSAMIFWIVSRLEARFD